MAATMNPRMNSAPLTQEDQKILSDWSNRYIGDFWWKLPIIARHADRRDADLMFECQRYRSYTFPVHLPPLCWPSSYRRELLACGGALEEWKTLNINYFA
jgi:hypothetical protein